MVFKVSFWVLVVVNLLEVISLIILLFLKDNVISLVTGLIEQSPSYDALLETGVDIETIVNSMYSSIIFVAIIISGLPAIFLLVPYFKSKRDHNYILGSMFKAGAIINLIIFGLGVAGQITSPNYTLIFDLILTGASIYLLAKYKTFNFNSVKEDPESNQNYIN